jgi:hypothetical protein
MTNLTAGMHLPEFLWQASQLFYEHWTCQISQVIGAKLNLLRGKEIGLAWRKIAFVAEADAVLVPQRLSAFWHARIHAESFSDEFKHRNAAKEWPLICISLLMGTCQDLIQV